MTPTQLSNQEYIEKCYKNYSQMGHKEAAELLSRLEQAQKENVRPDKAILEKADELYGESPSMKEQHAFREGCKWMYNYLNPKPTTT